MSRRSYLAIRICGSCTGTFSPGVLWFGGRGYQHVVLQGRGYFSSGKWADGAKVEHHGEGQQDPAEGARALT